MRLTQAALAQRQDTISRAEQRADMCCRAHDQPAPEYPERHLDLVELSLVVMLNIGRDGPVQECRPRLGASPG
jgi:hypothetical protein